jgi:hypothetical protein
LGFRKFLRIGAAVDGRNRYGAVAGCGSAPYDQPTRTLIGHRSCSARRKEAYERLTVHLRNRAPAPELQTGRCTPGPSRAAGLPRGTLRRSSHCPGRFKFTDCQWPHWPVQVRPPESDRVCSHGGEDSQRRSRSAHWHQCPAGTAPHLSLPSNTSLEGDHED